MGKDIVELEPLVLWNHFYNLTRIPRPSGHEEKVRAFVSDFSRNLGFETIQDTVGNILIRKPAMQGMDNRKGVILQAHLDMVPQASAGSAHDFLNDPINALVRGDIVTADGTTLGADNGIGVAAAMAVLESDSIPHGPLEVLFTTNEEAGMTGALGLQPGLLQGDILLNLDSEEEGDLFIGCAGGLGGTMTFRCDRNPVPEGYTGVSISVSGLQGGHSGMDIHLGRGNANKIMNRILYQGYLRYGTLLASIDGGGLFNAIPRDSTATVVVHSYNAELLIQHIADHAETIRQEMILAEPELSINAEMIDTPDSVMEEGAFFALLKALYACPNGLIRMSDRIEGLVETSNNLARVRSGNNEVTIECLLRSSLDSARDDLRTMITCVFDLAGAQSVYDEGYPGWRPDPDSAILERMKDIYTATFGKTPGVKALHAGLECGIIGAIYPELEMISFGPTIRYPHSPHEMVDIASVSRFWDFLVATLGKL